MKKMNNKGFSLVELIIVIAIMAILAAAIAPALIRYIDKSRKSNDVTAAKTIKTAVDTAMANETANSEIAELADGAILVEISDKAIGYAAGNVFASEVASNLSSVPSISYTKDGAEAFVVSLGTNGEIQVAVSGDGTSWILQPEIDASYK